MSVDKPPCPCGLFEQQGRAYSLEEKIKFVQLVDASAAECGGLKKGIGELVDIDVALKHGADRRYRITDPERSDKIETAYRHWFEWRKEYFGECDLQTIAETNITLWPEWRRKLLGEREGERLVQNNFARLKLRARRFLKLDAVERRSATDHLSPIRPRGRPKK